MDHAALDRPGPHDRHLHHQVVVAARLQTRQHAHLRPALDLEDAHGVGLADHFVGGLVVLGRDVAASPERWRSRACAGSTNSSERGGSQLSMPRASTSTLSRPIASRSSLSHSMMVRSSMDWRSPPAPCACHAGLGVEDEAARVLRHDGAESPSAAPSTPSSCLTDQAHLGRGRTSRQPIFLRCSRPSHHMLACRRRASMRLRRRSPARLPTSRIAELRPVGDHYGRQRRPLAGRSLV